MIRKILYPFLFPNGVLCGVIIYLLERPELPQVLRPYVPAYPWMVLAAALFLGWRFNRGRLLWFCALLIAALGILAHLPPGESGRFFRFALAILLPLNALAISFFREKGLLSPGTLCYLGFVAAQVLGVAWLNHHHLAQSLEVLQRSWVPGLETAPLPEPFYLSLAVTFAALLFRYLRKPGALEGSLLWGLPLLCFALSAAEIKVTTLYVASAGLMLVLGVVESSHAMAYRDELTGLQGRRALNEMLLRQGSRYTLAMLDIDHFKKFNDTHGHDVGDQVLKMVAARLGQVSGGGKAFRYGGEEFTVVFPRKNSEDALAHLEALRQRVEEARFYPRSKDRPKKRPKKKAKTPPAAQSLQVTISIGVAQRQSGEKPQQTMKRADEALYRAKKEGRNRVCC